jgi:hypothetical protein
VEEARPPLILLLVPENLSDELLEPLREHYAGDPLVRPIVDRRKQQRRAGIDRRMLRMPADDERRRQGDRRKRADRRAPLLPRDLSDLLPPRFAEYAQELRWAQRLDPVSPHHAALPTQALVEAIATGHHSCATELYWRCYERIYQRLREHMNAVTADAHTKAAFGNLLDRLGEFDAADFSHRPRTSTPFDMFLEETVDAFAACHNVAPGAVTP